MGVILTPFNTICNLVARIGSYPRHLITIISKYVRSCREIVMDQLVFEIMLSKSSVKYDYFYI